MVKYAKWTQMIQTRILLSTYIYLFTYTHIHMSIDWLWSCDCDLKKTVIRCLEDTAHWKLQQKRWMGGLELRQNWRDMSSEMEGCTAESSVYAILHVFIVRISRHLQRKHPLWINHYNEQSHVFFFTTAHSFGLVVVHMDLSFCCWAWTFRNPLKRTLVLHTPVWECIKDSKPNNNVQEGYWTVFERVWYSGILVKRW